MVQSITPRPGLPAPTASDTADPMNGREWDTGNIDLQYACTFPLLAPKDCRDPKFQGACDCVLANGPRPPLCDPGAPTTQIRGKAYPGVRELQVVRGLGTQGVVASLCPRSIEVTNPNFGYRPAIGSLIARARLNLSQR
jgi:hypothetical protein